MHQITVYHVILLISTMGQVDVLNVVEVVSVVIHHQCVHHALLPTTWTAQPAPANNVRSYTLAAWNVHLVVA
jgi:hypothetical protein